MLQQNMQQQAPPPPGFVRVCFMLSSGANLTVDISQEDAEECLHKHSQGILGNVGSKRICSAPGSVPWSIKGDSVVSIIIMPQQQQKSLVTPATQGTFPALSQTDLSGYRRPF